MPLEHITVEGETPRPNGGNRALDQVLAEGLTTPGPVIIMVHGFKFSPNASQFCPHRHILSPSPTSDCWKALSWPRELGFGSGFAQEGLGIAFGWHARGSIWNAYEEARRAGTALSKLIGQIATIAPGRPIHLIGHSLGARVILTALPALPTHAVQRVLLLNAAEYGHVAQAALTSPAGRTAELFNITSRENDLFDFMFERLISSPLRGDRSLSHALPPARNTMTIEIDHRATLAALRNHGFALSAPATRICHWSAYLRPGVFSLYRALLRSPAQTPMAHLQQSLPGRQTPRWRRVLGLTDIEEMLEWAGVQPVTPRLLPLRWRGL